MIFKVISQNTLSCNYTNCFKDSVCGNNYNRRIKDDVLSGRSYGRIVKAPNPCEEFTCIKNELIK